MAQTRPLCWHDVCVTLSDVAIVCTAHRRPHYLRETLASWQAARGIGDIHSFTLALGDPGGDKFMPQLAVWDSFRKATGLGSRGRVKVDSAAAQAARGMHRAIAEAADHVLKDPSVEFLILGEEDLVVSSDALEYFTWARQEFARDERVLAVCSHSPGGQGWDERGAADDAGADQESVRLLPYFQAWVWGTWRDRWEQVIRPRWDLECDSGGPMDSGWDWQIATRIIPQGGYVCAIPDASRSQNIGRLGGWAAKPEDFENTQAASFLAERPQVAYRLEETREQAA